MGTIIPAKVIQAIVYIINLNTLQLSEGSGGTGTFKWQDWHWTKEESEYWSAISDFLELYLQSYINKTISSTDRTLVNQNIKALREYCGNTVDSHRLLLKIAAFGTKAELIAANVKLGTSLAKDPSQAKSDSPALLLPITTVKQNLLGVMELRITNPETPTRVKLPKGMKFAKVYMAIGGTAPKNLSQYALYGNAHRGKIVISFEGMNIPTDTPQFAYFVARYESNKGEIGPAGAMVYAIIQVV